MPTLVIARHAHAEPWSPHGQDHDRALDAHGRAQARWLGEAVAEQVPHIDVALVSDATRTRQTWSVLAASLEVEEVQVLPKLYGADVAAMTQAIAAVESSAKTVMVVAHEPTVSATAHTLAGPGSDPELHEGLARGMATASAAVLQSPGGFAWSAVESGALVLNAYLDGREATMQS